MIFEVLWIRLILGRHVQDGCARRCWAARVELRYLPQHLTPKLPQLVTYNSDGSLLGLKEMVYDSESNPSGYSRYHFNIGKFQTIFRDANFFLIYGPGSAIRMCALAWRGARTCIDSKFRLRTLPRSFRPPSS